MARGIVVDNLNLDEAAASRAAVKVSKHCAVRKATSSNDGRGLSIVHQIRPTMLIASVTKAILRVAYKIGGAKPDSDVHERVHLTLR